MIRTRGPGTLQPTFTFNERKVMDDDAPKSISDFTLPTAPLIRVAKKAVGCQTTRERRSSLIHESLPLLASFVLDSTYRSNSYQKA